MLPWAALMVMRYANLQDFIFSEPQKIYFLKQNFGLYRDDGLILLRNLDSQQKDKKRKAIIKIFKDIGFSVDIQTNLKEVDFLDVTLNLQNSTYRPYKKPNDKLLCIHSSSKHPPQIMKQLPNSTSERLSKNSSNQEIFNKAKVEYEDALKKLSYNVDLKYTNNKSEKQNMQKRNIKWFNPPFSKFVSTNVAKAFLQLITKHFPRSHKLHKIFNRNTVKVSYSCMNNMSKIIKGHSDQRPKCNYRKKAECPMEGNCLVNDVVYKCDITRTSP